MGYDGRWDGLIYPAIVYKKKFPVFMELLEISSDEISVFKILV